jgi:hypothetical protein
MKKLLLILTVIFTLSIFVGCEVQQSVDEQQRQQQEQMLKEKNSEIGLPNIKEWTEKKMAKQIFELRDNSKLICYAYTKNDMTGKYVYEGRCMGFGLPYSTQYTNPERLAQHDIDGIYESNGNITMPQADPNGLFMPDSASATWLMMINEETGNTEVQYYEPNLVVTQSKKPARLCESWSLPKNY